MDLAAQTQANEAAKQYSNIERHRVAKRIDPIVIDGYTASLFATPIYLKGDIYQRFVDAAQQFVDAAVAVECAEQFRPGNVLFDRLYTSLSSAGKQFIDRAPRPSKDAVRRRFRRLDGYITPSGRPQFIEMNQSAPLAMSFYERSRQLTAALHTADTSPSVYDDLAEWFLYQLRQSGQHSQGTIAVSMERGYPAKFVDLPTACRGIEQAAKAKGFELRFILAEPTALTNMDGVPMVNGETFDLLWRNTVYLANYLDTLADYEAIRYGDMPMVNDLWSWLFRSKEFLAMIWDDELVDDFAALDVDSRVLREFVPLTYSLAAARQWAYDKSDWVLKRCDDGFGKGIVFGADCSQKEWNQRLRGDLGHDWIMQRLVEPLVVELPVIDSGGGLEEASFACDFDPYVVNGQVSGILVRGLLARSSPEKMNIVNGAVIGHACAS